MRKKVVITVIAVSFICAFLFIRKNDINELNNEERLIENYMYKEVGEPVKVKIEDQYELYETKGLSFVLECSKGKKFGFAKIDETGFKKKVEGISLYPKFIDDENNGILLHRLSEKDREDMGLIPHVTVGYNRNDKVNRLFVYYQPSMIKLFTIDKNKKTFIDYNLANIEIKEIQGYDENKLMYTSYEIE